MKTKDSIIAAIQAAARGFIDPAIEQFNSAYPPAREAGEAVRAAIEDGRASTLDDLEELLVSSEDAYETQGFINGFRLGMLLAGELDASKATVGLFAGENVPKPDTEKAPKAAAASPADPQSGKYDPDAPTLSNVGYTIEDAQAYFETAQELISAVCDEVDRWRRALHNGESNCAYMEALADRMGGLLAGSRLALFEVKASQDKAASLLSAYRDINSPTTPLSA